MFRGRTPTSAVQGRRLCDSLGVIVSLGEKTIFPQHYPPASEFERLAGSNAGSRDYYQSWRESRPHSYASRSLYDGTRALWRFEVALFGSL